jgi:YNFM family putative membrane transporter
MAVTLFVASVISDRIGRQQLMTSSLFAAASLAVLSAVLRGWHTLLIARFLTGVALAGIPAIAMAYVAEEVHPASIGGAMGLYIAGAAIGGMAGRLGASIICDLFGWRIALASVGLSGLIGVAAFTGALVVVALGIAIRLIAVKPLPQNMIVTEKVDTLRSV